MNDEIERVREDSPEASDYVPSPTWKRVVAWILFVIVALGILTWLMNIAWPDWIDVVKAKLS